MRRRRADDSFQLLSLLDLFACGLGAALILGFILMLARERQAVDASPSVGVMLEFRVEDEEALFTFLIKPPGNVRAVELGRDDLEAGRPIECGRKSGFQCVLLGWSRDGNRSLDLLAPGIGEPTKGRSYVLFLSGPSSPGEDTVWEVGVRYFNRARDWSSWMEDREPIKAARLHDFRLYSTARTPISCKLATTDIAFGSEHRCKVDARLE